jgi:hypothetical protein
MTARSTRSGSSGTSNRSRRLKAWMTVGVALKLVWTSKRSRWTAWRCLVDSAFVNSRYGSGLGQPIRADALTVLDTG